MPLNALMAAKHQRGVMLLEALIGILIFTVGILGLIGLQAVSVNAVSDAKYRADASFLANQILSQMWADNPTNLVNYASKTTAGATTCSFSGAESTNANVVAWLGSSSQPGTVLYSLPGTSAATQQILVGADNTVTITLCWRPPNANAFHSIVVGTQINGTAPSP